METDDRNLLREFANRHSEEAFATVVSRHANLVYSLALRHVRSRQLAEEVTQSVFTDLARNAGKLNADTILTAWLYRVTYRTAVDAVRSESRRQVREQKAMEAAAINSTSSDWSLVEPLLDEEMQTLDEMDRTAVLLRYFENKSLREVGETLRISEDAAQKRVSRAVDQLRESFSKRGVAVGAGGLVVAISANAVQAAPAGLAATISAAAVGTGTTVATTATITKVIAMTTLQKALVTAAITVAVGTGIYEARQASSLRGEVDALRREQAASTKQGQQLVRERDDAVNRLTRLADENAALKNDSSELAGLRDEVSRLKAAISTMKNPQMKERAQQKTVLEKLYAPLFKNLKLPAEQQEALTDLLLARKKALEAAQLTVFGGSNTELKQMVDETEAIRADYRKKIQELLGPQAFPVFQKYDATQEERSQIEVFKGTLPAAETLSDQQAEHLVAAMHEERKALPASSLLRNESPELPQFTEENIDEAVKELEQLQQRYSERAATILTPVQLEQFTTFQQQVTIQFVSGMKLFAQMFRNKDTSQPPAANQGQTP